MKKVFKVFIMVLALVALIVTTTGCYVNSGVSSNELGLQMGNGAKVDSVVGSGRYTNMGWFATIEKMDVSAKTAIWEDADLWTADKQPVNFKVSVTYARNRDAKSAQHMWEMYNSEARMDKALESLVLTRIPRVAKQVTTSMTLNEMIGISANNSTTGGREVLQQKLTELLTPELKEFDVTLLDIGVNDIGVDESYAQTLKDKAVSQVQLELAEQKTKQLTEQIKQEQAQTNVDLEIAKRKNLVQAEENKIFETNPQAFELERLRLLKDVVGDNDKIYFVPQGADLNMILSGNYNTPIVQNNK